MRISARLLASIGAALAAASVPASNNIDIGSMGNADDSGFIRIGTPGTQTAAFIADGSEKLGELRPVTFHLKSDPQGALQFGLITEEANQSPVLVIRDSTGTIQGVRYDELAPILLNEMQRQRATLKAQAAKLHELERRVTELNALRQEFRAALLEAQSNRVLVANR